MSISTNYRHSYNLIDREKSNRGRPQTNSINTIDKMAEFLLKENEMAGKRLTEIRWYTPERIQRAADLGITMPIRQTFKRELKHRITCSARSSEEQIEASRIYNSLIKSKKGKNFPANETCEKCHPNKQFSKVSSSSKSNMSNYTSSFKLMDIENTPKDQLLAFIATEVPEYNSQ